MNVSGFSRILRALSGLATILTLGAAGAPAAATPVSWYQLPADCPAGPASGTGAGQPLQTLACGAAGSFAFGGDDLRYDGFCKLVDSGAEEPAAIPVEPAPRLPAGFPCAHGSCLGRTAGRPWVALLDWPNEHAWSVAATVQEVADQRLDVAFYDLTQAGAVGQRLTSVSDLHVLVQLCALAEAVRRNPADRPLLVNLSFGRRAGKGDCTKGGGGLGCAVGRVLSALAAEGVLPVAAAGNDRELLFPAASPGVVAAGALDLAAYQAQAVLQPSAQTPAAAQALMLGYGLYLSTPAVDGGDPYWPAPPGSSYAAAFLSGWLGGTLAGAGAPPDLSSPGGLWAPLATASGLALARGGVPLSGSELAGPQRLLARALGEVPMPRNPQAGATLTLTMLAPPLPDYSVLYADGGNVPLPGVNPCVPCQGGGQGGMGGGGRTVLVDLSAAQALPAGMDLVALFLRVGATVYAFDGSRHPDLLAALSAGGISGLALAGVDGIFVAGEQPSLVLVVNVGGLAYWHEIPIQLLPS